MSSGCNCGCNNIDKSYVTLEENVCPVCGNTFSTGNILLHKRLKKMFNPSTLTGMSFCPIHQKQLDDGYIFLIGVKSGSVPEEAETLNIENADRTGAVAAIKREAAEYIFEGKQLQDINFVDEQVISKLEDMVHGGDGEKVSDVE